MNTTMRQFALSLLIALAAIVGAPGIAVGQQPTAAEKSYTSAARARAQLVDRLESLEREYTRVVRKIEERKRAGAMDTFAGKLELQNLLSEAKALSDRLGKLQDDVRALDGRLDVQRRNVLAGIDDKVDALERKLRKAPASERRGIVSELNALRQRRSRYSAPLPEAPSLSEVADALSLAEEVDPSQPEELEAAADELEDTKDQIRRRLDAVRGRLDELNRQKRLQRRDDVFRRETRIWFDEEQARNNRDIARVNRDEEAPTNDDSQTPQEPVVDNSNTNNGTNEPAFGGATEGDDGADFDLAAGESAAPPSGDRSSGDFTDSPGTPDQAPEQSGDDPFSSGGGTVVIAGGADPTLAVSEEPQNVREVNAAISQLEKEEAELAKQAEELEKKADTLRRKARDLQ